MAQQGWMQLHGSVCAYQPDVVQRRARQLRRDTAAARPTAPATACCQPDHRPPPQVTVTTAGVDMHSGLKGGSVQNANHALVQLLGTLKDERQRVAVAGFYSDVVPMTWQDRDDVKTFTRAFDAAAEQDALGIQGYMGEEGYNMLEQR